MFPADVGVGGTLRRRMRLIIASQNVVGDMSEHSFTQSTGKSMVFVAHIERAYFDVLSALRDITDYHLLALPGCHIDRFPTAMHQSLSQHFNGLGNAALTLIEIVEV